MKAFIPLLLVTVTAAACFAQAPRADSLVSPEVHPDRRVTFRVRAPKAAEASLFGDWMAPNTQQSLTKDDQGVWSATLGPLEPGLAIYTFTIDGVTTPDPVNPRIKLRARTSASSSLVPKIIVSVARGKSASARSNPSSTVSGSLFALSRPTHRSAGDPLIPLSSRASARSTGRSVDAAGITQYTG